MNTTTGEVTFKVSHQYLDDGVSGVQPGQNGTSSDLNTICVTVTDDDRGSILASDGVTVSNVVSTLSISAPDINENGTTTLSGTLTDIGLLDIHDVEIDWDDANDTTDAHFDLSAIYTINASTGALTQQLGTVGQTVFSSTTEDSVLTITSVNTKTGVITFTVTHQYLDDGVSGTPWPGANGTGADVSTISVMVVDDDLGSITRTDDVKVTNLAPDLVGLVNSSPDCGGAFMGIDAVTVSATFSDIGRYDTHSISINWGDGITTTGTVTETIGTGTGTIDQTEVLNGHVYAMGGIFTITVTLTLDGNKDLDVFWANLVADNGGALDTIKTDSGETKLDTDF